jgi:hypothetical protein
MSEYFIHLVHDVIVALEHNSVALENNNEAMRVLLRRIESGEISGADAQLQKSHLMSVSDRLQEERLRLVNAAKDVRVRAPVAIRTNSCHETVLNGFSQVGPGSRRHDS